MSYFEKNIPFSYWNREDPLKAEQRLWVEEEIHRYLEKGRTIKVLPPQEVKEIHPITFDGWAAYESLSEIFERPPHD